MGFDHPKLLYTGFPETVLSHTRSMSLQCIATCQSGKYIPILSEVFAGPYDYSILLMKVTDLPSGDRAGWVQLTPSHWLMLRAGAEPLAM